MCITATDAPSLLGNPATYSAIAAAFSALAALFSYGINRSSLASKLTDRLYDFDKLILSNAAVFQKFIEESNRQTTDYFDVTALGEDHIKLKAFAYYYLNLFDEIFEAYGRRLPSNDTWKAWQHYMFERIKHPLLKELLLKECGLAIQSEKLVKAGSDGPSVFSARFSKFLTDNYDRWKGPCARSFW